MPIEKITGSENFKIEVQYCLQITERIFLIVCAIRRLWWIIGTMSLITCFPAIPDLFTHFHVFIRLVAYTV